MLEGGNPANSKTQVECETIVGCSQKIIIGHPFVGVLVKIWLKCTHEKTLPTQKRLMWIKAINMIIAQTHFAVYNVPTWTKWAILNVDKYFLMNNLDLYIKVVLHNSKTRYDF